MCIALATAAASCSLHNVPRPRLGSYATATVGTNFLDLSSLGEHQYFDGRGENNGIVYTCRGGHIDIAHVRIAADYTKYHYERIKEILLQSQCEYIFKLNVDRSQFYARWTLPADWKDLPRQSRERIADETALELASYFTFMMVSWHEVLTFFGFKTMGVVSEFPSAFSWEDNYSNLLGVRLGAAAIRDGRDFDAAMTAHLEAELRRLGIQSAQTARQAAEAVRGQWYEGHLIVNMLIRHTHIGLDDGTITPLLVPDVCEQTQPQTYPAPTLETAGRYGFTVNLKVEPREFEKDDILNIVCPDGGCRTIGLPDDLAAIMQHIEQHAQSLGCRIYDPKN